MLEINNIEALIKQQKTTLAALEKDVHTVIGADIVKENQKLKAELQATTQALGDAHDKLKAVTDQRNQLKNALYEQVYNEKIAILGNMQKRYDRQFASIVTREMSRFSAITQHINQSVARLKHELEKHDEAMRPGLMEKLDALTAEAEAVALQAHAMAEASYTEYRSFTGKNFDELRDEKLTYQDMANIGKKNNWEAFVGGNLINKVGVLFIILGIITVSRFAVLEMPDTLRGVLMFALSVLFLVAGEFFTFDAKGKIPFARRVDHTKPSIFSLGLTSVGVAGMYASLVVSYFTFGIIAMVPALVLCVLITGVALVLSTRYNSQTVATFALVGGYIPAISITGNATLLLSAMGYFVVLNMFVFMLSFYKKWRITMFTGFVFSIATMGLITDGFAGIWRQEGGAWPVFALLYVTFIFAIYTIVPLMSGFKAKAVFAKPDVALMAINTVVSAIVNYMVLDLFNLQQFNGLLALWFAVVYLALGMFVGKIITTEKYITPLFYLTGLIFVALVVPLQFGSMWVSLGWLVQAVVLGTYAILKGWKRLELFAYALGGLCIAAFASIDVNTTGLDFTLRYTALTGGSLIILAAQAYMGRFKVELINVYKYAAIINAWVYTIDTMHRGFNWLGIDFMLTFALAIAFTFLFALVVPKIPGIGGKGVHIMGLCFSVIAIGGLLIGSVVVDFGATASVGGALVATGVIVILSALALLGLYQVLMYFVLQQKMSVEWLPFGLSFYFLVMLVQNLVLQYNVAFTSMFISIVFVVAALLWIIFGFVKRFIFMRRFGLALSILAIAKLFLVDLPGLTDGYRVVSYFAFGATLLGISFVYQYFSKVFALKLPEVGDEDEPI